ncbi:hypothetical protein LOTGIDRAFT_228830 [Lottia gigantea]|uniref:Mannosyltransferase n=1 Tax=Lottia gigantea TaxID=225164 RepID=V4BRB9_LOTGI|nr:hypothetical protein LOTGIDRAFT_228830 [Lottia gigantea]ESO91399.1 hypothetical protein LOTGIDRAFT_228830 [Lottia gigantea]
MSVYLELSVIAVMVIHILVCPYTKVEESFNLQAIHDVIYHNLDIEQYDHLEFPGVVPRSFIGPVVIAFLSMPMISLSQLLNLDKMASQYIVRFWLGLMVAISFISFSRSVGTNFGKEVKTWLIITCLTQFHFMFYMSRPLPNIFALVLVLFALSMVLSEDFVRYIWLSGAAVIIYRTELVLLLGPLLVFGLLKQKPSYQMLQYYILHGILAAISLLALTIIVDSVFWKRWLWPEGEVWWYNIVLNKSSNWGTEPFFWYFYSALVRAISFSIVLLPIGVYIDRRIIPLLSSAVIFIILFSFLPHKELRFIIYTFPVVNLAIASALKYLWINRNKSIKRYLSCLIGSGLLAGNLLSTAGFLYISHHNYPGGQAIQILHSLNNRTDFVDVHIDVYSAQTGISRFTQLHSHWRYDKTEDISPNGQEIQKFTHLLLEATLANFSDSELYTHSHELQATIPGFTGISLNPKNMPPVKLKFEPKIWILKKKFLSRIKNM